MDIKTLLNNLHEEVSCSVCMTTFTDPKQLPCLHSFCLHCLNGIQRTSGLPDVITCPECRRESRVPDGNLNELPTNFRINSLLDVLAIRECNTTGVKCGNCDKKSSHSFYCFQCCAFWCDDCITGHNIIRANKEHRVLALKDFKDQDIEDVLKRPAFCQQKHHEKEELKFFCKDCEVAICNACALTDHEGHPKILLKEAANERKLQVKSVIESEKLKAQQKRNKITQLEQTCIQIQEQAATVKRNAHRFAEKMIGVIKAKKQEIFHKVESQERESLQRLAKQKREIEHQVKMADKTVEQTETLFKQSTSAEIVQLDKSLNTIFQEGVNDEGEQVDCDLEGLREFIFVENGTLMDKTNTEGIGSFKVLNKARAHQSSAEGNVRGSPFAAEVKPRQFRPVLSFGQQGSTDGMLHNPWGVAVNERDEIAVTETGNHRVQVYSSDGTYLRSFGRKGDKQGEFNRPTGIAFDSNGNVVVVDSDNHRVQRFSEQGEYLSKFGGPGRLDDQLNAPHGLSVDSDGNIIIADRGDKLIKIFSPSGQFLRKIGRVGSFTNPLHCVHYEKYFIVSDSDEHCIKVFGEEGNFLYTFGKKGEGDGEFNTPRCLSVNKAGHLMVCDELNHRVQVFELSGKFITKFETKGSGIGKFKTPVSTAVLSDGRIVVSDWLNHHIKIFE